MKLFKALVTVTVQVPDRGTANDAFIVLHAELEKQLLAPGSRLESFSISTEPFKEVK